MHDIRWDRVIEKQDVPLPLPPPPPDWGLGHVVKQSCLSCCPPPEEKRYEATQWNWAGEPSSSAWANPWAASVPARHVLQVRREAVSEAIMQPLFKSEQVCNDREVSQTFPFDLSCRFCREQLNE